MKKPSTVCLATPAPIDSLKGNSVSARRIAHLLTTAGYEVALQHGYDGRPAEAMIALHARRSAEAIARYRKLCPHGRLCVLLTGTDLYHDIPQRDTTALRSLELADVLILAQEASLADIPSAHQKKVRVIEKSVTLPSTWRWQKNPAHFVALLVGHLRAVKAPMVAAKAARLLATHSRLQLRHLGEALEPHYAAQAQEEMQTNQRYHWAGPVSHAQMWEELSRASLALNTSTMEGGANSVAEAIAAGVPVLATDIAGNRGLLGDDYSGYFPVGDAHALSALFQRAETETNFYQHLCAQIQARQPRLRPERERNAWVRCLES